MKTLDLLGSLASLSSTYLFAKVKSSAWPIGIIAIFMNSLLYWQNGIYADMCLEVFYLVTFGFGWYKWYTNKKHHQKIIIKQLRKLQWFYVILFSLVLYLIILYLLKTFSNSNIPILDALTTALSITAQFLLCYSRIENWIFWFITDALYIMLYFYKNLPFHVFLVSIYMLIAVIGYLKWNKLLEHHKKNNLFAHRNVFQHQ